MRVAGVSASNIAAGVVTDDAVSSIETCINSFGSRTLKAKVSTMFCGSTLNEYCTVENIADGGNSRRTRTQIATPESGEIVELLADLRNSGASPRVERPRSTSKSGAKLGLAGMRASAEDSSCFSSGEGEHTFNIFTLTLGWD